MHVIKNNKRLLGFGGVDWGVGFFLVFFLLIFYVLNMDMVTWTEKISTDQRRDVTIHTPNVCVKGPQAEFGVLNSILTSCIPLHRTNNRQGKRVVLPSREEPLITCFDP